VRRTIAYIIAQIKKVDLDSAEFRELLADRVPFVDHFLHEFRSFAQSPYELEEYDRRCEYHRNGTSPVPVDPDERSSDEDGIFVVAESARLREAIRHQQQQTAAAMHAAVANIGEQLNEISRLAASQTNEVDRLFVPRPVQFGARNPTSVVEHHPSMHRSTFIGRHRSLLLPAQPPSYHMVDDDLRDSLVDQPAIIDIDDGDIERQSIKQSAASSSSNDRPATLSSIPSLISTHQPSSQGESTAIVLDDDDDDVIVESGRSSCSIVASPSRGELTMQRARQIEVEINDSLQHRRNPESLSPDVRQIEDDSDIEVIAELKPKHMRTPPLVDIDDDDDNNKDDVDSPPPSMRSAVIAVQSQRSNTRKRRHRRRRSRRRSSSSSSDDRTDDDDVKPNEDDSRSSAARDRYRRLY
jgi:hypothetical protein